MSEKSIRGGAFHELGSRVANLDKSLSSLNLERKEKRNNLPVSLDRKTPKLYNDEKYEKDEIN